MSSGHLDQPAESCACDVTEVAVDEPSLSADHEACRPSDEPDVDGDGLPGAAWSMPARDFDFSSLAAGAATSLIVAPAICVEHFRDLRVVVRVHKLDIAVGGEIAVRVRAAAPTDEEPSAWFPGTVDLGRAELDSTTAPGTLFIVSVAPPLPTHVQVQIVATMTSPPGALVAILGVDVEGRR